MIDENVLNNVSWDTDRGQRGLRVAAVTVTKHGAKHPKVTINEDGVNMLLGTETKGHILLGAVEKKLFLKICTAEEPGSIFLKRGNKFNRDAKFISEKLQLAKTAQAPLQTTHRDMFFADFG
jgi:hypothetical protein